MERHFSPVGGAFLVEEVAPETVFIPEDFQAEDRLIGQTAEDFLRKEVMPQGERIEQADYTLMRDLMRKAGELGLLGADVPEVYGGLGLSQPTAALIAEKLNPQQSFALTHEAHTVIATLPLLYFGNHDQKSRYLPKLASGEWIGSFALSEANSGSDALAMETRATLTPDGKQYLLNGTKMWITNTAFADLFTVFAKVDGEKVTGFLVERTFPGVSFGKEEHKLGMHGTSTRRVILDEVLVPIENVLEVGKGHYAAFCALNMGRFKLEAGAVGGLKETLATCTAYAKQRKTFGHPLAEYGLIQHKLAEMAARTFALESMVYRLAGDLENAFSGIVADAPDASLRYHRAAEEYAIECNIVKVIGSETYSQMTDEAIQIHGGYGYTEEFPLARAWRDQRLLRIGEGANEIVRLAIINTLLRRDKAGRLPLLTYGKQISTAMHRLCDGSPYCFEISLAGMGGAVQDSKQLVLFLLTLATEQLGEEFSQAQEIIAAIADIVCGTYALESVWLRASKLQTTHPTHFPAVEKAALVVAWNFSQDAVRATHYILDSLEYAQKRALLEKESRLAILLRCLTWHNLNPIQIRRDLAKIVLEKDGYFGGNS